MEKRDTFSYNAFLIRETYHYMAAVDDVPSATQRLYDYLGVNAAYYDSLIATGYGMNRIKEKLVSCGFSDTLFRPDSPTKIKTSNELDQLVRNYLLYKDEHTTLKDFRYSLAVQIGYIRNGVNGLLAVPTWVLLERVKQETEPVINSIPDPALFDFVGILDEIEFEGHYLQKDLPDIIAKQYHQYRNRTETKNKAEN